MTQLQVEVADFHDAASTMRHDVAESVRICLDGLSLPGELVGEDPAGESWSAAYDPAARAVLRATAQLSNAAAKTSLLFAQCGHNYARAEAASTTDGADDGPDFGALLRPLPTVTYPSMPRSGGAGNGTPAGWWLVEHTIGYVWPGGHQDRLRSTAAEWRAAAGGIEHIAFEPVLAAAAFARDRLPEADDIATICGSLSKRLRDLAHSYRTLGEACDSYADHLDQCHDAVRDELGELLSDSAVTQGTGAALAIVTFGGSEAVAQAAQAGRIAVTATRVSGFIERMIAAGRRVAEIVERVHNVAQEIDNAMRPLAAASTVVAGVTKAQRVPRTGRPVPMTAEQKNVVAAVGRLAQGVRIKRPLTKTERTHILDGDNEQSGGHRYPGNPGKETFPREWSDEKIIGKIEDIINSDDTQWRIDTGSGGLYTKRGQPAVWRAWEVREGVTIRVVWVPATGRVVSAYPDPDTTPFGGMVPR